MLLAAAFLLLPGDRRAHGHYVWVLEKTTAAPAVVPGGLRAAVQDAAAAGGGSLVSYAVGPRAARLGPVPLAVDQLGDTIADPARRAAAVDGRLTDLAARSTPFPSAPTVTAFTPRCKLLPTRPVGRTVRSKRG